MVSPELVHSIKRFTVHEAIVKGRVDYHFVSNVDLKTVSNGNVSHGAARSPATFIGRLAQCVDLATLEPPFRAVFDKLLEACECSPEILMAVMKRMKFLRGPSREGLEATIAHEHLAVLPEYSELAATELGQLRDDLVAAVYRASSLQVTDPARHLRNVIDREDPDPTLMAKRLTIETLRTVANRPMPSKSRRDLSDLGDKVDQLLARMEEHQVGSLNREQVQALLKAFAEENVEDARVFPLLLEKARELEELRRRLAEHERERPDDEILHSVYEALDRGDYDAADAALEQIIGIEIEGGTSEVRETLDFILLRASLAETRLRYGQAAELFETAAGVARLFDQEMAFHLGGEHAAALVNDAVAKGGAKRFKLALDASERRVNQAEEGSEQHLYAVSQYVSALALYSERSPPAPARNAIEAARRLASPLVEQVDPEKYLDVWVTLASTLGTALSRLAQEARAFGENETADQLLNEAITTLERAIKLASPNGHPELSNAHHNLATALRRRSDARAGSTEDLDRAISSRENALALLSGTPSIALGNVLDSLGNDYKSLAVLGPALDREAFGKALDAYRRALKCRKFANLPADWFRTNMNIATMFAAGAQISGGPRASRFRAQAIARLRRILDAMGPEDVLNDWMSAVINFGRVVIGLLQSGELIDAELYTEVAELLDKAARIADGGLELHLMLQIHEIQEALPSLVNILRHPDAIKLINQSRGHLHARAQRFGSLGPGPFFSVAAAQADFMVACLQCDILAAEAAFSSVHSARELFKEQENARLVGEIADVLAEMKEMIREMEIRR